MARGFLRDKSPTLFLMLAKPDDAGWMNGVEAVRRVISNDIHASFVPFSFADGCALLMGSTEPATISANRATRDLSRFADWIVSSPDFDDDLVADDEGCYFR